MISSLIVLLCLAAVLQPATSEPCGIASSNRVTSRSTRRVVERPTPVKKIPPGYRKCKKLAYKYFKTKLIFRDAEMRCKQDGGTLATPRNKHENHCINRIRRGKTVWLGFNDNRHEGKFVDKSNNKLRYSKWSGREPNDWPTAKIAEENCATMWSKYNKRGEWNDLNCRRKTRFVCQV